MKRNRIIILIVLINTSIMGFSTDNYLIKDTMMYVSIDVRGHSSNPIVVNGLIKNFDSYKLSKENVDVFIASFYKYSFYVPDFIVYDEAIEECVKLNRDGSLLKFKGQGQRLMNLIAGYGQKTKIILETGETVFISITEISGLFINCSKEEIRLPTISNTPSIDEFKEIGNIYVPIEILSYNKPSRKRVKKMFK